MFDFDEPKRMTMMDDRLMRRLGDRAHTAPPPDSPMSATAPTGFDAAALKVVCAPSPAPEPVFAGDSRR
jgi:hypothetical protein